MNPEETKPSYSSIHMWLRSHYKKTVVCTHCGTDKNRTQWALKKGFIHAKNIDHYIELCRRCHFFYDFTEETRKKMSEAQSKLKRPHKQKIVIKTDSTGKETVYQSVTEAAKDHNIDKGAIWEAVTKSRKIKKAANCIWRYG